MTVFLHVVEDSGKACAHVDDTSLFGYDVGMF